MAQSPSQSNPTSPSGFSRTRWSLVLDMQHPQEGQARRSLNELSQRFWYPVYAYARRSGHAPEIANDLCLGFFGHLPAMIAQVDPRVHGRFRDFLLMRLHDFLTADWRHDNDDARTPSLSAPQSVNELEQRLAADHPGVSNPEQVFQRSFALEVLARSLRRLREEAQEGGRTEMFQGLLPFLSRDPVPGQYEQRARALGSSPLVLVIAVKRLRQRFRELADDELMETVASPSDLESERAALLRLLSADGA